MNLTILPKKNSIVTKGVDRQRRSHGITPFDFAYPKKAIVTIYTEIVLIYIHISQCIFIIPKLGEIREQFPRGHLLS